MKGRKLGSEEIKRIGKRAILFPEIQKNGRKKRSQKNVIEINGEHCYAIRTMFYEGRMIEIRSDSKKTEDIISRIRLLYGLNPKIVIAERVSLEAPLRATGKGETKQKELTSSDLKRIYLQSECL